MLISVASRIQQTNSLSTLMLVLDSSNITNLSRGLLFSRAIQNESESGIELGFDVLPVQQVFLRVISENLFLLF